MDIFIKPENRQTDFLILEKNRRRFSFFLYRYFILLYKETKHYLPEIRMDLYRNKIIITLQLLNKSLFLFYGKSFLFYSCSLPISGKYIFRDKWHPEYNESCFKMLEWGFPIVGNHSQTRRRMNPTVGNHSQT